MTAKDYVRMVNMNYCYHDDKCGRGGDEEIIEKVIDAVIKDGGRTIPIEKAIEASLTRYNRCNYNISCGAHNLKQVFERLYSDLCVAC